MTKAQCPRSNYQGRRMGADFFDRAWISPRGEILGVRLRLIACAGIRRRRLIADGDQAGGRRRRSRCFMTV